MDNSYIVGSLGLSKWAELLYKEGNHIPYWGVAIHQNYFIGVEKDGTWAIYYKDGTKVSPDYDIEIEFSKIVFDEESGKIEIPVREDRSENIAPQL